MRVDSWDEEEEQLPVVEAPAEERVEAPAQEEVAADDAAPAPEKTDWRRAIATAPGWLWALAILTIGPMCLMFVTIMILIATR